MSGAVSYPPGAAIRPQVFPVYIGNRPSQSSWQRGRSDHRALCFTIGSVAVHVIKGEWMNQVFTIGQQARSGRPAIGLVHPLAMDIAVLGPMEISISGRSLVPTARKTRSLLALLALNSGRMISTSRIREELWGDEPPRSASTTLQTYVMQLRNALAEAAADQPEAGRQLLQTCGNGYALNPGRDGRSDLVDFERQVTAANRRLEDGDLYAASILLRDALELWRGTALADVQCGRVLEAEVVRLEQRRRSVQERRIQIDLTIGRHHDVVDELAQLALQDRTDEGVHGHLMLALHRCGRRAHALHAFHQLRAAMLDELGLEPSPKLHQLQRAILEADPELETGGHFNKTITGLAPAPDDSPTQIHAISTG